METQTNLFHHLKQNHTREYEESQKKSREEESSTAGDVRTKSRQMTLTQLSIAGALASSTPYDRKSKRWNEITEAVTYCLAKDMMPIQTVEKEGFKRLVKKLDPRYNIPGRKYFSKTTLPVMYEECRDKLAATLSSVYPEQPGAQCCEDSGDGCRLQEEPSPTYHHHPEWLPNRHCRVLPASWEPSSPRTLNGS